MSIHPVPLARAAIALAFALVLSACGGGGEVVVDPPRSAVSTTSLRALPAEYLARKAVSYSPFRTANRDTEKAALSDAAMKANIKQDLDLLVAGNFKLIRLFDSSDEVSKRTLEVIRDNNLDIKVHLGAYVNSFKYALNPAVVADIKAKNKQELDRLVALASDPVFKNIVLTVSVGNETMVVWSIVPIEPVDMAGYITYVRDRVAQPVTTDDNFLFFATPPKIITDVLDFVSIHTYAEIDTQFPASPYYWDWRQQAVAAGPARAVAMMNAAMVATRAQYQQVRDALDRKGLSALPIVIGETGWNAVDVGKLRFRAHPSNQKLFYNRLETWRAEGRVGPGPANLFYFEAFDEPWKGGDDKWGLFNVAREARYVIQHLYSPAIWETGTFTDAVALFFSPPVPNAVFAANKYTLFSDAPGAVVATGLQLNAFDGTTATRLDGPMSPPLSGDGTVAREITPTPRDYGWGLLYDALSYGSENLSAFAATGTINFLIKTTYPGKIEIGISTDTATGDVQEAYLQIGNGDYGYHNDDAWHLVSIPLQSFLALNPKLDLSLVLTRFAIADRYSFTGKPLNSGITTKIAIDGIQWSR